MRLGVAFEWKMCPTIDFKVLKLMVQPYVFHTLPGLTHLTNFNEFANKRGTSEKVCASCWYVPFNLNIFSDVLNLLFFNWTDSPKKSNVGRPETRLSDISCMDSLLQQSQTSELRALEESFCECECSKAEDVLSWQTSEHTGDFADTSSVVDYMDSRSKVILTIIMHNHT